MACPHYGRFRRYAWAAMVTIETLCSRLTDLLGQDHVSVDPRELASGMADLFPFPPPERAAVIVRPASSAEVARCARLANEAGYPVVARGAGLSYTRGLAALKRAVIVDTTRLSHIDIHADDCYAVVGAGATWQALFEALEPLGLRSLVPGPISGAVSTVGGAVSQYVPGSMDGVIGLRVVLSDGSLVTTGSASRVGSRPFHRHAGPDLSGLFIGDCGAFGIKTEVVLRLVRRQAAAYASFSYSDPLAMIDDLIELRQASVVTRILALDQSRGQDASRPEPAEALRSAAAVASSARSAIGAVRELASMVRGKFELAAAPWSLHLTAEGPTATIAEQMMALARERCQQSAREIEAIVPKALHARPYSIRGFVGMEGERWVPVHGMVPLSQAAACFREIAALLDAERDAMADVGVHHGCLIACPAAYVTIEPMFFWPDALDDLHVRHLSERNRKRFSGRAPNPDARALVMRLRERLRDCFERHDAVHAQVGRFYRHVERLDPGSARLLQRLREALDAPGLMNPGVLKAH